ncbi:hypothetical protein JYU34_019852 [Plutella xylostella]|uniref:Reverse transcriptase domain-containing protein n=2 Tax=Plutella xylostella TaxID=51655 RepID=A0ABQ7PZ69_PLUXY|nr:hypothetical protein JYU34_019852 [Plutella xylostella]
MELRLASWNVRSLFRPGAMYQVSNELQRYNIGIAALQEVRWPGKGECNVDNGTVLFYSGGDAGQHTKGTGFMVSRTLLGSVIKFDAVSDRLCILRIRGKFNNYCIINAYAPTEVSHEDSKDEFYDHVELNFEKLPCYDTKILLGDFNAQVGQEDIFIPTIGRHSKHEISNDNGIRLISFASSKGMVIKSTMHPHKDIHKGTWKSPDGRTVNQIDHVLIDDRHKNTIRDVRTFRGADCDSDHYLLGINVRAKIKLERLQRTQKIEKIDIDKLKDQACRNKFQLELNNRFRNLNVEEVDIDKNWESIRDTVKSGAINILGHKKRMRRKKWWNEKCQNIVEERRKLRNLAEQCSQWEDEYKKVRAEAKRVIREAKRHHLDKIVKEMETLIRANESRRFYMEVKSCKKGYQPTAQVLIDDDENLVTDKEHIKNQWRNYFHDLLNCPPLVEPVPHSNHNNDSEVEPPSFEEVRAAIMRLKNNKAPGIDGLPSEIWKYCGGTVQSKLYELLLKIWEAKQQPQEWNTGVICPVHKKGCKKKCTNYRGIALLPTAYKILSYVLLKRLEPYAEKILGDYQCGFRPNRSTIDQLFLIKQIMEKKWEYAQSVHALFVDFAKAYDSIDRGALYAILRNFDIPAKLVELIEAATRDSNMQVRVGGEMTEPFPVVTGLKQGDALSPMLFNLVLEYVLRKVLTLEVGIKLNGRHKVVGYADDLALLGETSAEVRAMADVLGTEALKVGLRINHDKTEYLNMTRSRNNRVADLQVGNIQYKGVVKFKYLGCTINATNSRDDEINIRVQNALRCSAALHKVLTSRLLSRSTKLRIYKTIIRPILMYGCEAWTLTLKEENKLLVAERKILRKILGQKQRSDGSWRILKNAEIEELVEGPNIIGETKAHRLRWLGHLERMGEDRSAKRAYQGQPSGKRPVGRPRYRWRDVVLADLRELQASDWQDTAQDRGKWRVLVSEAKTHFGSLRQRSK